MNSRKLQTTVVVVGVHHFAMTGFLSIGGYPMGRDNVSQVGDLMAE